VNEARASEPARPVLSYPAFAFFFVGRIVSILSFQMLVVAIGWQLYSLTGSAFDLGLLGLAQFVPMIALTLVVGHVADRYDHRHILLFCQLAEAAAAAILAIGTMMGWLDPIAMFAVMMLAGSARAFEIPTMVAIIPALVPRSIVPQATAYFATANQAGSVIGPVLGGFLYGLFGLGPVTVYGAAIALWCVGAGFIFMMRMEFVPRASEPVSLRSALGGFFHVWKDRVILGTISLDMCAVFLGGVGALFPVFARDILQTGPWGLGLLRAAPGVGAFAMSLVLARWPLRLPIGVVLFCVIAVFGGGIVVFGLSNHILVSLAALAMMGAADVVSVVIRFSLVQLRTTTEMRGRVSAVNGMFTGTSNYLGDFRAGAVAQMFGAVPAVVAGGLGVFVMIAIWLALFPDLRRVRSLDEMPAPEPKPDAKPA
jgi:MFS family permease